MFILVSSSRGVCILLGKKNFVEVVSVTPWAHRIKGKHLHTFHDTVRHWCFFVCSQRLSAPRHAEHTMLETLFRLAPVSCPRLPLSAPIAVAYVDKRILPVPVTFTRSCGDVCLARTNRFAACLRRASWITDDSWRHDQDFSTDHGRTRHDQPSKRSVYPFLTGRSASWLRPLLARATSVWSNAVTSCSAWRRCRRVQSDFTSSVTHDTFHARERFVRTCVAGS